MRLQTLFFRVSSLAALSLLPALAKAGDVEVMHYWTTPGSVAAINVLEEEVTRDGHSWKRLLVEDASGDRAMETMKKRVLRGNPPSASQAKGPEIQRWAQLGFLQDLSDEAQAGQWDQLLPPVVAEAMKPRGEYVALPANIHRVNWMWVNKPLLDKFGGEIPETWAEFEALAKRIKAAGYTPVAQSSQPYLAATLFETVALGTAGEDAYRDIFVNHKSRMIKGEEVQSVFRQIARLKPYFSTSLPSQDWDETVRAVIRGDAVFVFMGDWAKEVFNGAGKVQGKDYLCAAAPGTKDKFIYNVDSLAMFKLTDPERIEGQKSLVRNMMSKEFQIGFNKFKGSIPARMDIDMSQFDGCAQESLRAFHAAEQNGSLVPTSAHGMAASELVREGANKSIWESLQTGRDPKDAAADLSRAIRYGQYLLK